MSNQRDRIKAVLWDFGGVFTTSPFANFTTYEAANGLPKDFIRTINARNSDSNAWALMERNDVTKEEFGDLFAAESKAAGHEVQDEVDTPSGVVVEDLV